jgi:hypothetical protein
MRKVVALFGSQAEASQAVDALAQWQVRTEVIESADSVDLLGEGRSIEGTGPSTGDNLAPPTDPSDPFADTDLGNLDAETVTLLIQRARRGASVVVIDAAEELLGQVHDVLQRNKAQVYEAD